MSTGAFIGLIQQQQQQQTTNQIRRCLSVFLYVSMESFFHFVSKNRLSVCLQKIEMEVWVTKRK